MPIHQSHFLGPKIPARLARLESKRCRGPITPVAYIQGVPAGVGECDDLNQVRDPKVWPEGDVVFVPQPAACGRHVAADVEGAEEAVEEETDFHAVAAY